MKKLLIFSLLTPFFFKAQVLEKKNDSLIELEYLEFEPIELFEPLKVEIHKRNKRRQKDSLVFLPIELIEPLKIEIHKRNKRRQKDSLVFLPIELIEPLKIEIHKRNKRMQKDSLVEIEFIEAIQFEPIPYLEFSKADSLEKPLILKFTPIFKKKHNVSDTLTDIKLIEPIELPLNIINKNKKNEN